jgi:hypothetical protein
VSDQKEIMENNYDFYHDLMGSEGEDREFSRAEDH